MLPKIPKSTQNLGIKKITCSIRLWHPGHMNRAKVVPSDAELKLSKGFDERHALDVSDSSTELYDADFGLSHVRTAI